MVRPPRRLIASFLLVLLAPATLVVVLGTRLIEQDRALELRQMRERRETDCDQIVAHLQQALSATERRLASKATTLVRSDDDAVVFTIAGNAIETYPKGSLPYYPVGPRCAPERTEPFARAEEFEFRSGEFDKAVDALRVLADSVDPGIRAGTLLRLARNLRKAGRPDQALPALNQLAEINSACLSGLPADLIGRRARAALLEDLKRTVELRAEARGLQTDLASGRWRFDRGTYESYAAQLERWLGEDGKVSRQREALAEAVEWIWRNRTNPNGRHDVLAGGIHVAVVWQGSGERLVGLAAGPAYQQREWFAALDQKRGVEAVLTGEHGEPVRGRPSGLTTVIQRTTSQTGLPWTVQVMDSPEGAESEAYAKRRQLMYSGLILTVLLVIAAGYSILRAISREFAVAQLQSDFVSAVSHEFRTPLTSLRQFNEMLLDNEALPAEKRRTFYEAQARATGRLQRLVESLLDFGRMERGKRPYQLDRQPVAPMVNAVLDEFEREPEACGFTIEREIDGASGAVDADREAFGHALWNLLDNAVKYSNGSREIKVSVQRRNGSVAIGVCDHGLGIRREEQREIFKKFVRGQASKARGIQGTGIGLAIVQNIVDAHYGRVLVESAPGKGSTFTILLPGKDG